MTLVEYLTFLEQDFFRILLSFGRISRFHTTFHIFIPRGEGRQVLMSMSFLGYSGSHYGQFCLTICAMSMQTPDS